MDQAVADKLNILFLCTANACRSQMAEGWTRHLRSDRIDVTSAGISPGGVSPQAIKVMAEVGIDLTGHTSDNVDQYQHQDFDFVVTVCDCAKDACPVFPGRTKPVHHSFPDPPILAAHAQTEQEALDHYRYVRDLIRDFVLTLPEVLLPHRS